MKIFTGKVISTNMQKTATVAVARIVVHPLYKKRYKRIKKYHVHDELGTNVGEVVHFVAGKPESKLKKWKIIEVVTKQSKKGQQSKAKEKAVRNRKGERK